LPELLQDVVQQYELPARQKGVALEAYLDGGTIPFVTADIGLIQRAVENPLQNAIRHTPEGGTVKVKVERQSGDVLVTVADTGPGIAEEDIEHVFERSYRGARHRPEPGDGAGLGLAISKRIMELHGGRIWVESEPGQGATFMLSWPIEGEGVKEK
jgi:signal transduction histidine kinase